MLLYYTIHDSILFYFSVIGISIKQVNMIYKNFSRILSCDLAQDAGECNKLPMSTLPRTPFAGSCSTVMACVPTSAAAKTVLRTYLPIERCVGWKREEQGGRLTGVSQSVTYTPQSQLALHHAYYVEVGGMWKLPLQQIPTRFDVSLTQTDLAALLTITNRVYPTHLSPRLSSVSDC